MFAVLTLGTAGAVSIVAAFITAYMLALVGNKILASISYIIFFTAGVGCFYVLAKIIKKLKRRYNADLEAKLKSSIG